MLFNVLTLLQEPVGSSREYDLDDHLAVEGGDTVAVRGRVRFDRTPRGILVRARVSSEDISECSRCLRPARSALEFAIEEEYIPTIDLHTGSRIDAPEDDSDPYRINDHHELDLRDAIAQYWTMAKPMAPLCKPECAGLCPVCGADLERTHACTETPLDPRWAKLASLSEQVSR